MARWLQRTLQIIAISGIFLFTLPLFAFVVDQREMAVVLRFGRPVRALTSPGLYWRVPGVETVRILPATLQFWGDSPLFAIPDLPTKDDKKIELIPWAIWKINDPIAFVQRLRTVDNAEQRVAQFVRGAIRDVITQHELAELVRSSNRELQTAKLDIDSAGLSIPPEDLKESIESGTSKIETGRLKIIEQIKADIQKRLAASSASDEGATRGIELVDVGMSKIDFVASVREKTFDRWIAERGALSALNVNEGERLKQEILNQTKAEVEKIEGEGKKKASEQRGKVDAEVIDMYAKAIQSTGEFFEFVRTLELYEKSLDKNSTLYLSTDNELLHLLEGSSLPTTAASTTSPAAPAKSP
jgi:membrane protease subunit HflC